MISNKIADFVQEIGTIMYVGGILSHIVISAVLGHPDSSTVVTVYTYKEMSAYILILPGMALKVISDLYLYYSYEKKPNWLKIKLLLLAFLAVNAFVFLVPMMPELVDLASASLPSEELSQEFIDKTDIEQMVGMSNALPLLLEILLGSFKPKLFTKRKI